jgi:hypothetical protein
VERDGGEGDVRVVSVADDGPGMRPRPDSPRLGVGLPLTVQVARSLDVINDKPGTTVCMRFGVP